MTSARIIADSLNESGDRLTTMVLKYPRFVHSEMMTHRVFSRSAGSSRAIPVSRMLKNIQDNPVIPNEFGANISGMQAKGEVDDIEQATKVWLEAKESAVENAQRLLDLGVHKQVANRILEPFSWITVIVSSTDWSNFFAQRCSPLAQPEIRVPAEMMREALSGSFPRVLKKDEWHLPFITDEEKFNWPVSKQMAVSTARCARVSYLNHDGEYSPAADLNLFVRLVEASPPHACYSSDTEVLTDSGWKLWPDVEYNDALAAVDLDTRGICFETPSDLHEFEYSDKMMSLKGSQVDLMVTPNHNLVCSFMDQSKDDKGWLPFRLERADALFDRAHRTLKSGILYDRSVMTNPFGINDERWAALVGFFVGDGYADKPKKQNPNRIYFHLKKPEKISFLYSLGIEILKQKHNSYSIAIDGIGDWFRSNCYDDSDHKILPTGWMVMPENQWRLLKEGLRNSDGSSKRSTWVYGSTSKALLDQIQALAHLNGEVACLNFDGYFGRINFSDRISPRIEIAQQGRSLSYSNEWLDYSGKVYCATVSTGVLMVRRNNKVVLSGNSPLENVATPAPFLDTEGNFEGWQQLRHSRFTLGAVYHDVISEVVSV